MIFICGTKSSFNEKKKRNGFLTFGMLSWKLLAYLILYGQIKINLLTLLEDFRESEGLCALPCRAPLSRKLCRLNRVFLEARYWIRRCNETKKGIMNNF